MPSNDEFKFGEKRTGAVRESFEALLARTTPGQRKLGLIVWLAFWLFVGSYRLVQLIRDLRAFDLSQSVIIVWELGVTVVVFILAFWPIVYFLAWRRFEKISLEVARPAARLGEEIEAVVRFTPRKTVDVSRIALRLLSIEEAVYLERRPGDEKDSSVPVYHQKVEDERVLQENLPVTAGMPYEYRTLFRIPVQAMHTFRGGSCSVDWKLELQISTAAQTVRTTCPLKVVSEELTHG